MGSSWFARFGILAVSLALTPAVSLAQAVSAAEREALVKLRTDKGGQAAEVDALITIANEAGAKSLPAAPLTNKIREGLAKGADPRRIDSVVRQMATHLETADRLMREFDPAASLSAREGSVTLLGEALGGGVTADEVRELRRITPMSGKPPVSTSTLDGLASAARSLSLIKEARLPAADGSSVVAEAVRQGYRPVDLMDLGREVKRREADYRDGRANLRTLREAIARGERPDRLFRDARPPERPAGSRPDSVERPARPETPQRTEPPARPERPATPRGR